MEKLWLWQEASQPTKQIIFKGFILAAQLNLNILCYRSARKHF